MGSGHENVLIVGEAAAVRYFNASGERMSL